MDRRILIDEAAFTQFSRGCKPDAETKRKIGDEIERLKTTPEIGLDVPHKGSVFYLIGVGDYRVHYVFNEREVKIAYIGIYGRC